MSENKKNSPAKFLPFITGIGTALGATGVGASLLGTGILGAGALGIGAGVKAIGKGVRSRRNQRAQAIAEFDKRIGEYERSQFEELDPDDYQQENIYEDLTVDTEAVDYAREQFQQQQANIMQSMRGVVGSSGVAGLAQTLSNEANKQSRESQIYITKQLAQNKKIRLAEQSRIKQEKRQIELNNALGRRQFEADKMSTLIGVAGQKVAGANQRIAGAQAMTQGIIGGLSQIAASAVMPRG
tara:strand:+ start:721 stop:1443 length:723 start_codon:yes stop_codon:yes gene_type:complete